MSPSTQMNGGAKFRALLRQFPNILYYAQKRCAREGKSEGSWEMCAAEVKVLANFGNDYSNVVMKGLIWISIVT